jgi:thioredoxin reductase
MTARVAIVGGGVSGLSAAIALRRLGVGEVVVHERETETGGAPRHTDHLGFGMRDLRRVLSGPEYARRLTTIASDAGARLLVSSTVHDLDSLDADAVVLATGVRERPRTARLVAGDRPAGVYTTGQLQQITAFLGVSPGRRAVIVGAEHVSMSAVITLRSHGCEVAAMVTERAAHESHPLLVMATVKRARVPLLTSRRVTRIVGRERVESVELDDGTTIECDTVVFTGDWVGEHEVARHAGVALDDSRRAVAVDDTFRTSRDRTFAIGNLVHPARASGTCAIDGRRLARHLAQVLGTGR